MEQKVHFKVLPNNLDVDVQPDKYTDDSNVKYKLRSLNLIKHNPNFFTNKGNFLEIIGGNKTLLFALAGGLIGKFYRRGVNVSRNIPYRMGIWNSNIQFLVGTAMGSFYGIYLFGNSQLLLNDYFAQCLFVRYPDCKKIERTHIYSLKNQINNDEHYYFTQKYLNTYHI